MLMTIFGILILAMALFLVVTILMQSSRDHRLSGTIAGGAETFFGKQKGKTMDGVLNKITIVVCIVFFLCVLLMYIFQGVGTSNNNTVNGDNTIDLSDYINDATDENGENTDNTEDVTDGTDDDIAPDGTGDSDEIESTDDNTDTEKSDDGENTENTENTENSDENVD